MTRIKDNTAFDIVGINEIEDNVHCGVREDRTIEIKVKEASGENTQNSGRSAPTIVS